VNPEDLRAFAGRDWRLVEDSKRRYWSVRKQALSPAQALAVSEGRAPSSISRA
jgi:hypothetical protein